MLLEASCLHYSEALSLLVLQRQAWLGNMVKITITALEHDMKS